MDRQCDRGGLTADFFDLYAGQAPSDRSPERPYSSGDPSLWRLCRIECTAFESKDKLSRVQFFGTLLAENNGADLHSFHSSGTEIMYNGSTGEQLLTDMISLDAK